MTYGQSKNRDMVRSILPSTKRRLARGEKRNLNRIRRTNVKQILRTSLDAVKVEDDLENSTYDVEFYVTKIAEADAQYSRDIKYVVNVRRDGDKIAPFQRWAVHQVKDLRLEDRLSQLRASMPDNLPVRHAISHLTFLEEFDTNDKW